MGEGAVNTSIATDEDDATRAAILATARAIAERDGVEKLTLGQVAAEANIPRTAVYRLFTRKEDLLMSIAADDLTALANDMRGQEWPEGGDTPDRAVAAPTAKPQDATVESIVAAVAQPAARASDAWLERRLRVFEKALAAMEAKQEELERHTRQTAGNVELNIKHFEDKIGAIDERVDETANRHKATANELRQILSENLLRIETVEHVARAALAEPSHPVPHDEAPVEAPSAPHVEEAPAEPVATPEPVAEKPAEPAAFVERRRPENQGAVSFIVERRKSMIEAQVAADAARAAAEPERNARLRARRQRYLVASAAIGVVFILAAVLAFARGMSDGRAMARHEAARPTALAAVIQPHVMHASRLAPLDRLTAAAQKGDAKAELIVGTKYLNGEGTAKDPAAALRWLQRSAVHGQPVAQYMLATLYQQGVGTPVDMIKATQWYEAAALQGNRKAMHDLAIAYAEGNGGVKNPQEAARWFSRAASYGYVDSQFDLAVLYERGDGVPQSLLDAYKWYAIASMQGDSESANRIEALRTQMSSDDLAVAENAAKSFRPLALDPAANVTPTE
jgi:TPR repeat protein/AcrR family transcriptional regulator